MIVGLGQRDGGQRAMMVVQRQERRLQLRNVSRGPWADLVSGRHGRESSDAGPIEPPRRLVAHEAAVARLLLRVRVGPEAELCRRAVAPSDIARPDDGRDVLASARASGIE